MASGSADLILNKREIETTVTVDDGDIIERARDAAERLLADDPALTKHPALAQAINARLDPDSWAALAKS